MNNNALHAQLYQVWQLLVRLRVIIFVVFVAVLYGLIAMRIQTLSSVEPSAEAVASQSRATSKPTIDAAIVEKVQQLEDRNVTVKVLFDQARKNPFRE